jgi:hypothetical protein
MRILILFLVITTLQLSSCTNRQVTAPNGTIEDTTEELIIQSESGENEECEECWKNPYVDDVEGDPDFFKKIENGDTDAFEIFYRYTTYTYEREDILNVIKYALLLGNKYHYSYGYHFAAEGYVLLYENYHYLSDSDKKKLVSYCWNSYYKDNKLKSVYRLRNIYKGGLDPSMQDEEQYKICDSIINTWKERYRIRLEENK